MSARMTGLFVLVAAIFLCAGPTSAQEEKTTYPKVNTAYAWVVDPAWPKRPPDAQWSDYLRKAFEANEPWDRIVRAMIASDGRADDTRPAMKLLADGAGGEPNRMTRDISRLFLGRD